MFIFSGEHSEHDRPEPYLEHGEFYGRRHQPPQGVRPPERGGGVGLRGAQAAEVFVAQVWSNPARHTLAKENCQVRLRFLFGGWGGGGGLFLIE